MQELTEQLRRFAEERDWKKFHSPKNLAISLSVEAAELLEHFQWLSEAASSELPNQKVDQVRDEIGDVLIYLVMLADSLGIDPVEAAFQKLEKNRENYPADLVRGKSLKWREYPR
jgi:NTP pyrophosphatase (non-canonical NTP hydrolase)